MQKFAMRLAAVIVGAGMACVPGMLGQFAGAPAANTFKDVSMLKPPAGQRVAVIVFEDLECPACAHAHPIITAAAAQYHVPIVRYDFPLQMHLWSMDAAVFARYLQEKVNPKLADDYRTAVFAQQISIGSKDDLQNFTRRWMQQHGQSMPFVVDPQGTLAAKVHADYNLGMRLGVSRTPTIVVATAARYQAICGNESGNNDPAQVYPALEAALAQTRSNAVQAKSAPAGAHAAARTARK